MWRSIFSICLQGKDHAVCIPEFPVPRSWLCSGNIREQTTENQGAFPTRAQALQLVGASLA